MLRYGRTLGLYSLAEEFDVYDLNGRKVLDKATSLDGLSNGVYIVNGKKVVIK